MGNEQSYFAGIEIDQKPIEVSDFWIQHTAYINAGENTTELTVFIGELFVNGPLWKQQTPLEKSSKNLMVYRHPYILKYISSWQKNSRFHLAVEPNQPLSQILPTLNTLQICIGLHSILKALCFLHERAAMSHNNICVASIYVTKEGIWKLGGMEYLCQYKELTCDYLNKTKLHRYSKAIDNNEEKNSGSDRKDLVDLYAFGILSCEVLQSRTDDEILGLTPFLDMCKNTFRSINASNWPKFSDLLVHEFFKHEFVTIYSFLMELPLKLEEDKTEFFSSLVDRLRLFNEQTVGSQLAGLLLSRMVLLNKTAQCSLLPRVLCPRTDFNDVNLFSKETFSKYVAPKLLHIFSVRDAQIRLLLLEHFPSYFKTFTEDELRLLILPELLLGIKDTNDNLVATTLRVLADLVPVLGAQTVIGGKRAKLFNDGRPTALRERRFSRTTKVDVIQTQTNKDTAETGLSSHTQNELPERPRPDGEEGETTSTGEIEQSIEDELDNWEEWDNDTEQTLLRPDVEVEESDGVLSTVEHDCTEEMHADTNHDRSKLIIRDITKLDIKNQLQMEHGKDEFNFFQDMEPVIQTNNFLIPNVKNDNIKELSSKLSINLVDENNEDGWGDEEWE